MWPLQQVKTIFRGAQSCKLACVSVALFSLSFTFAGWADPTAKAVNICLGLRSVIDAVYTATGSIAAPTSYSNQSFAFY